MFKKIQCHTFKNQEQPLLLVVVDCEPINGKQKRKD